MESLTVTITDPRLIDGWVEAANRNSTTPEAIAAEFLEQQGKSYAELFGIATITGSAFIRRFKQAEYIAIMDAAEKTPEVATLVDELTAAPNVVLFDPRLEPGLQLLAEAGLIARERITELLAYERPEPAVK